MRLQWKNSDKCDQLKMYSSAQKQDLASCIKDLSSWFMIYEDIFADGHCDIPLNIITAITGVSGSGKSSLIHDCFYGNAVKYFGGPFENAGEIKSIKGLENVNEVVMISQEPIGKSARSNPASYIKIYDEIRKLLKNIIGLN